MSEKRISLSFPVPRGLAIDHIVDRAIRNLGSAHTSKYHPKKGFKVSFLVKKGKTEETEESVITITIPYEDRIELQGESNRGYLSGRYCTKIFPKEMLRICGQIENILDEDLSIYTYPAVRILYTFEWFIERGNTFSTFWEEGEAEQGDESLCKTKTMTN